MLACLVEGNQKWAKNAPALMISVAYSHWKRDGKHNRHAGHDVGMASSMLAIQAETMGLATHFMAGFHIEKARETYNIPADCEPMAAVAIGYPGDPETLPEDLRARELAPRPQAAKRIRLHRGMGKCDEVRASSILPHNHAWIDAIVIARSWDIVLTGQPAEQTRR